VTTRKKASFDFGEWAQKNLALILSVAGMLVAFYFTTQATLNRHEAQFVEVAKKFDLFNVTQERNFATYAANQKEEKNSADKAREALLSVVNTLSTGQAAGTVKIETITKTLDGVVQKLDVIQSNQKQPISTRR
jgi:hypothetical protein